MSGRTPVWVRVGAAVLVAWMVSWAFVGGMRAVVVLLHWPIALILLAGYVYDLRGGVIAAAACAGLLVLHKFLGDIDSWTVIGWQVLVFWVFGLYPFKFMQIREQRQHHYRTLIDYKRGEIESLEARYAEADGECARIERKLRAAGGGR